MIRVAVACALVLTCPAEAQVSGAAGVAELLGLRPGTLRDEVLAAVGALGLDPLPVDAHTVLIEEPMLASVFEEQQTILLFDSFGRLVSLHIRVEPDPGSRGTDVLRTFADVRAELTRVLGRPSWERDEGLVPPDELIWALSEGSVVRYLQWEGEHHVRAGVPRRVDGEVFVEVVVTATQLPRSEEYWGFEG